MIKITYDSSYMNEELINRGYAEKSVHSLNFDRYYTEEQKAENSKEAKKISREEWIKHCDEAQIVAWEKLKEVMKVLSKNYRIYQFNTMKKDYDLFFWSNRSWRGKEYYDSMKISFNNNEKELLNKVLELIKGIDIEGISCRVQYKAVSDQEKVFSDGVKKCNELKDKFVVEKATGMIGKIKRVSGENDGFRYGFFKKGSKKHYYPVSLEEILLDNFELVA